MHEFSVVLKKQLLAAGASLVGIGGLAEMPPEHVGEMRCGVSIAVAVSPSVIGQNSLGPTAQFYAEYKSIMDRKLPALGTLCGRLLCEQGYQAVVLPTSGGGDPDTLRTPISHKMVATRGGLGWIGKNGLLITEAYGAAIMLISVLTDAPLTQETAIDESACGDCRACVLACPGKALSGKKWCIGVDRNALLDPHRARKTARQRALDQLHVQETVCGICIAVCPRTKAYVHRADSAVEIG